MLTFPHSGEQVPPEAAWLKDLPSAVLLTDIDRFVDELWLPALERTGLRGLAARVHRYAADLNRFPDDVDQDSVLGAEAEVGRFTRGFHWVKTTLGDVLMRAPISRAEHDTLVTRVHDAFHEAFAAELSALRSRAHTESLSASKPQRPLWHLDCHSMPSIGEAAHRDRGEERADVVISDLDGKSASYHFKDVVVGAFETEGFRVSYNWPYYGGRMTERYGNPAAGHETIQVELNRKLYMSETTRERTGDFSRVQERLARVLEWIVQARA